MNRYPLRDNGADDLRAFSGKRLDDVTAEALAGRSQRR